MMGTSSVEDVLYWGTPEEGPWTTPKEATNLVDIAHAGTHVIGLTAAGRVIEWNRTGLVLRGQPQDLTNAISIYGRNGISGSLCANGKLSIWKPIVPGSSVFQTNFWGPYRSLGFYNGMGLFLRPDQTIDLIPYRSGGPREDAANRMPSGLANVVKVTSDGFRSGALLGDGHIVVWGDLHQRYFANTNYLGDIVDLWFREWTGLALRRNGDAVEWDTTASGIQQPPVKYRDVVRLGEGVERCLLKDDGTLVHFRPPTLDWDEPGHRGNPVETGNIIAFAAYWGEGVALRQTPMPTRVYAQPRSARARPGGSAEFHARVLSARPVGFSWKRDGETIVPFDRGTASLILTNVSSEHAGNYTLWITNAQYPVPHQMTTPAELLIDAGLPPVVVAHPEHAFPRTGSDLTLRVAVEHSGSVAYQWMRDGVLIPGANRSTHTLLSVSNATSGAYSASASTESGITESEAAIVSVLPEDAPKAAWMVAGDPLLLRDVKHAATDAQGRSYVAGVMAGPVQLQGQPVLNGANTAVLGQAEKDGRWTWIRALASSGSLVISGVAAHDTHGVWLSGGFSGQLSWGPIHSSSTVVTNAFVARWNQDGGLMWIDVRPVSGFEPPSHGVSVDNSGNAFIVNREEIIRYSSDGRMLFAWSNRSEGFLVPDGVGAHRAGFSLFGQPRDFYGGSYFLASYSSGGRNLWSVRSPFEISYIAQVEGSPIFAYGWHFAYEPGSILEGGAKSIGGLDATISLHSSDSGVHRWSRTLGGRGNDRIMASTADRAGNTILSASLAGTGECDGVRMGNSESRVGILGKMNSQGRLQWARHLGDAEVLSVSYDSSSNLFLVGRFAGRFRLDSLELQNDGVRQAFVACLAASSGSPRILKEPEDVFLAVGVQGALQVGFAGSYPIQIQWFKDGVLLAGQSHSVLDFGKVQTADLGHYWTVASNALGSITSRVASVRLGYPVVVKVQGNGRVIKSDSSLNFEAGAELTLSALPDRGSRFLGWSGDVESTNSAIRLIVDSDKHLTARFSQDNGVIRVTSFQDRGPGTLRSAIEELNRIGGGTIRFADETGRSMVRSVLPTITSDCEIIVPAEQSVALTGSLEGALLSVAPGVTCLIRGLQFQGIQAIGSQTGGAISNAGTLFLDRCTFNGNTHIGLGGAIFSRGVLNVQYCRFEGNHAGMGGALFLLEGETRMERCLFIGNTVSGFELTDAFRQLLVLSNGVYTANSGGAVCQFGGRAEILDSEFLSNGAVGTKPSGVGHGAGLSTVRGETHVVRGRFFGNFISGVLNYYAVHPFYSTAGSAGFGGGIFSQDASLLVSNSLVASNIIKGVSGSVSSEYISSASLVGGGGISVIGGAATLEGSTITGNSVQTGNDAYSVISPLLYRGGSALGGGLHAQSATLWIRSCTIVQNRAFGGMGSYVDGLPHTYDSLGFGAGGVVNDTSTVRLLETLVADNLGGPSTNSSPDFHGVISSLGSNLVESTNGNHGWSVTDLLLVDPKLGPLQHNGGPTESHALLPGSPAIDAADAEPLSVDQRGFDRPIAARGDIGAYEFGSAGIAMIQIFGSPALELWREPQRALTIEFSADLVNWNFEREVASGPDRHVMIPLTPMRVGTSGIYYRLKFQR
ncbi:MAG: hypothetical protein JNN07_27550 [Verrucomicrobiales bacterium]|nr:hypothetical protein [Verrucomicrobiales bacterium]